MIGLFDDYSYAIGYDENMFTADYFDEFRNFVFEFLANSYPALGILGWLENDKELIRFDIVGYELKTNNIDIKITKFSDYKYHMYTINTGAILKFNVANAIDNIFCVVTKNEKLLSKYTNNI